MFLSFQAISKELCTCENDECLFPGSSHSEEIHALIPFQIFGLSFIIDSITEPILLVITPLQ